jgi:hypothetical protein
MPMPDPKIARMHRNPSMGFLLIDHYPPEKIIAK